MYGHSLWSAVSCQRKWSKDQTPFVLHARTVNFRAIHEIRLLPIDKHRVSRVFFADCAKDASNEARSENGKTYLAASGGLARLGDWTGQREAQWHSKVAGLHGDAIACAQIIDSNHATTLPTILTT